jgi:AcrR family transcriptional regulator|tara:strand:- start:1001 stop:1594 length:594 start_codon:yes stop_codon:yes gene_type:complete
MILDCAAKIVADEGVAAVSMERLSKDAKISKALVYNYYPSVTVLLQTLLNREYRHLRKLQLDAAESAETLEQLTRRVTKVYLSYIKDRGMLIERLAVEPSVANSGDPTKYGREAAVTYLAQIISDNFNIDMQVAKPAVDISYGMPAAAGQYLIHHDVNLQTIEDITVTMILGSYEAIQKKYETSLKPLIKRPPNKDN